MSSMEFGIRHYAGQVWYNVEGFLDKNRDTVRPDVMALLVASKDKVISRMFMDLRNFQEASRTMGGGASPAGHLVTMKPRTPTVAARFQDSLNQVGGIFFSLAKTLFHFSPTFKSNSAAQILCLVVRNTWHGTAK